MSYIGQSPVVGNFQICDAISVVNGQAAYTMQVGSANVFPETANNMIVSLNGVIQKPNTAYTISGATITFASNLASGDVIDFIQLLGDVLDIGTPSDGTVTSGKLASNSVTTAKITDSNVTGAKTNFVSTSSAAGLQIKGDGTTDGTLQLNCSQNSHGIKLASPAHSSSQSYTLKFPTGNVTANKFLKVASVSGSGTSGIGQLSFADAGGGKIGQVVSVIKTDKFTTTSSSFTDVTGMTVNITPSASSSKILIMLSLGAFQNDIGDSTVYGNLVRGSTALAQGNNITGTECTFAHRQNTSANNNFQTPISFTFLDSPSTTNQTTYKLQGTIGSDNGGLAVNSSYGVLNTSGNTSSTITVMEILA